MSEEKGSKLVKVIQDGGSVVLRRAYPARLIPPEEARLSDIFREYQDSLELARLLYEIVDSGSSTPVEDGREAMILLKKGLVDELGWTHPTVGQFADSVDVPLHHLVEWKEVPNEHLQKVLDRLIVYLTIECEKAHHAWTRERDSEHWS